MSLRSEARFIGLSAVQSGMMVTFAYKKSEDEVKTYTAIVVDPAKPHKTANVSHFHALLIDDLTDFEIIKLAAKLGNGISFNPDDRNAPLTDLASDESYAKYFSEFKLDRRYRTFLPDNILKLRQILIGAPEGDTT